MTAPPITYGFEPLAQQQGMLCHVLADAGSRCYEEQVWCTVDGPLDADALQTAWSAVVRRHDALRSSFALDDAVAARQRVHEEAPIAWAYDDSSGARDAQRSTDGLARAVDGWPIPIDAPPLMRLGLWKVAERRHVLAWKYHHLILDGWSAALVLREMFQAYDAAVRRSQPVWTHARPFREYVDWVRAQDHAAAAAFWRELLHDVEPPLRLDVCTHVTGQDDRIAVVDATLPTPVAAILRERARSTRLTMGTVLQAAWALALSHWLDRSDVVFGLTCSGRSVDVADADRIVGPLANTIPVRVKLASGQPIAAWLQEIQATTSRSARYQWASVSRADLDGRQTAAVPLFDTAIAYENYPLLEAGEVLGAGLRLSDVRFDGARTGYPLLLLAMSRASLDLRLVFDRRRVDPAGADAMAASLIAALDALAGDPGGTVDDLRRHAGLDVRPAVAPAARARSPRVTPFEAPALPIETAIADIWRDLLALEAVGLHDNFFDLGGHSLAATRMIARVNETFGVRIPLAVAFGQGSTVASLADCVESAIIEQASDEELAAALAALEPAPDASSNPGGMP